MIRTWGQLTNSNQSKTRLGAPSIRSMEPISPAFTLTQRPRPLAVTGWTQAERSIRSMSQLPSWSIWTTNQIPVPSCILKFPPDPDSLWRGTAEKRGDGCTGAVKAKKHLGMSSVWGGTVMLQHGFTGQVDLPYIYIYIYMYVLEKSFTIPLSHPQRRIARHDIDSERCPLTKCWHPTLLSTGYVLSQLSMAYIDQW